jgi:hypothetical protein
VQWKSQHLQWLHVLGAETKFNDDIQYTKIIKIHYFSCESFASTMLNGSRGETLELKIYFSLSAIKYLEKTFKEAENYKT